MGDGLRGVAGSNEQDGRVVVKVRIAGLEADGLEDLANGLLGSALSGQGAGQVGVRVREVGPQPQGLDVVVDGLVGLALVAEGGPEAVVGEGQVRLRLRVAGVEAKGLRELARRGVESPGMGVGRAEIVVRYGNRGVDPHRFREMADGLRVPALAHERHPEIVVGLQVVGKHAQRLGIVAHRLAHLTLVGQDEAEVVVRLREVGLDAQGRDVVRHGLVEPPLPGQGMREVALRAVVPRRHLQGMLPEGDAVAPVPDLRPRGDRAREDHGRRRREDDVATGPAGDEVHRPPGHDDEESDGGDVGVAVRPGLAPHLHQPQDWYQSTEVPEPADGQVGMARRRAQGQGRGRGEDGDGAEDLPRRRRRGIGIDRGQAGGPDHLDRVRRVGQDGGGETAIERKDAKPLYRARVPLDEHGDDARHESQSHQGQLLDDQPAPRGGLRRAAERPEVEEEQDEGQGDQHRLGHEPQREEQDDQRVTARARPAHVDQIGPEGQEEEQPAQDVLALRDPGHRFHVQGMELEERGHERAPEERARHPQEQAEEEERVDDVKHRARQMVRAGVEAEELDVEHVREPRQGMPVPGVSGGQRPRYGSSVQPARHCGVLADVLGVVEVHELVVPRGRVHERTRGDERGGHEKDRAGHARRG